LSWAGAAEVAPPLKIAVTRKIWSFQITGVARPDPGISVFHFTFLVSLQLIGGLDPSTTPVSEVPLQVGQESLADAKEVVTKASAETSVVIDLWVDSRGSGFMLGRKLSVRKDNVGKVVLVSKKSTFDSLWNGLR
jgi:hypothetical protein